MKLPFKPNKRFTLIFSAFLFLILIYFLTLSERQTPEANIKSFSDGLWYALVTLTTVGYGDYYPITPIGKIIGLIIILCSLGILGLLLGKITTQIQHYMQLKKQGYFGTDQTDHFIIIGWDDFSKKVVDQILKAEKQLSIITDQEQHLDQIYNQYDRNQLFVRYTSLNEFESYKKANINHSKKVFINFNDDSELLFFTINLKKHYPTLDLLICINKLDVKDTFSAIGIEHIVSKNDIAAKLIASHIFEPDVAHFTDDLISTSDSTIDLDMMQYRIIAQNPYCNKPFIDTFIDLKKRFNTTLIGLSRNNQLIKNPKPESIIKKEDFLIIISNGSKKKELEHLFNVKEGI